MVNEQLINWIKENQAKGYSLDNLKGTLITQGYPEKDIAQAMSVISGTLTPTAIPLIPSAKVPTEKKSRKKLWWILGTVLGVFLLLIIALLAMPSPTPNNPAPPIVIPEPGPTSNYAFSQNMEIVANFTFGDQTVMEMSTSTKGVSDVINQDIYMKTAMVIKMTPEEEGAEKNLLSDGINSEMYLVNGTMYSKSEIMGITSWTKMPVVNDSSTTGALATASTADTIAQLKSQLSNPDFNTEIISENPLEIKLTMKKDSPSLQESLKNFRGMMDMMSSLFSKGGMTFEMSDPTIEYMVIHMKLDNFSRPLESSISVKLSADVKVPASGNCSKRNETNNCIEWETITESGKMIMELSGSGTFNGYNEQQPIVVPQEAINTKPGIISEDQIETLTGSMSDEEKQKIQDLLASLQ